MPAPFYNAIKGTTSGAPTTGAFTPNAASSGYRAWSTVPAGWVGLVRFEDGSAWELSYCYFSGTTLSRGASQLYDSSTGSVLSLTSAATAEMVADASEIMSHLGTTQWRGMWSQAGSSSPVGIGLNASTVGTAAATSLATTNYLTEQHRTQFTSLTTAAAQAGMVSPTTCGLVRTTAGRGGIEFVARFGVTALPTGPRLFVGLGGSTWVATGTEPSAFNSDVAFFGKDSTDTNIQLITDAFATSASTKIDTGIPLVVNGWYEASIWIEPGSQQVNGLLIRLDTGAVWYGKTSTDVPNDGSIMIPQIVGGLSSTTGTAIVLQFGSMAVRSGS